MGIYDSLEADRAVDFIKKLRHTKGEWAGHPFNLMPWEEKIIRDLFGTFNEDGTRQYREAYISTARKNGKTELAGAIACLGLFGSGEQGAEVYTAAGDRDQASLVFDASKTMVTQNKSLMKISKIVESTKRIVYQRNNSFYRAISHESFTKHGYNPYVAINDEVHVWPNRSLYDVLKTGQGARRDPLMVNITTSGYDLKTICGELYKYAKNILKGIIEDPTFYVSIFELDEGDDWTVEENWYKANPGLGVYRDLEEMRQMFKRARSIPAFENTFKRLYLNMWTEQSERWLPMEAWDACNDEFNPEDNNRKPCFTGLDLASSVDIAAFVRTFENSEGGIDVDPVFFVPEENIKKRAEHDRVPYDIWARQGFIRTTPGNVIDYAFIEDEIEKTADRFDLKGVVFDRWGAVQITQRLAEKGIEVIPMGQGFQSMNSPTKELMKLVLSRKIRHNNNPVLRWMASNMVVKQDPTGALKPDKSKSTEKIDGMVATIMALDLMNRTGRFASVYDERGPIFIDARAEEEKKEQTNDSVIELQTESEQNIEQHCPRCDHPIQSDICEHCGRIGTA